MSTERNRRGLAVLWTALLVASCAMTAHADDKAADKASGKSEWQPLFNGRNLDGWQQVGPGKFVVENGMLKTVGGMGLLWYTPQKIGNAVIKIVYRAPDENGGGNSGVFIRIPEQPTEPMMPVNRGYEVQIDESDDEWHRTGVLYSLTKRLAEPRLQEWNTMEITLDGERTMVTVNGTKVTDYREGDPVPEKKQQHEPERGKRPVSGYIGVQNHGDKDTVYFKEVSLKRLSR